MRKLIENVPQLVEQLPSIEEIEEELNSWAHHRITKKSKLRLAKQVHNHLNIYFMKTKLQKAATLVAMCAIATTTWAQGNGVAALEKANAEITSYVEPMTKLFYVVCAVIGLIGAIKVYGKWSAGSSDTTKTAASWFGACVFAVVAVTAIRAFFIG